ncbi:MAG: 5'-nucleotidase C-terminal domain-containing protein [Bacteroidia bacterium]|nr:5'-nucleotidase C-terminal domain-containing protein [Bacteroidia bacterium]
MRNLKFYKHCFAILLIISIMSCKKDRHLSRIEGLRLEINDSLGHNKAIDSFISPYRDHVNKNLDSVISYSVDLYSKGDGELNTAIGNMMADIVFEQAEPIYKSRTGNSIDMVLLNHGGIRSILPKGPITTRTAYEIMPFENSIVVVEMKMEVIDSMLRYLVAAKRAHPVSGLKLWLSNHDKIVKAEINGSQIDSVKTYSVATNDYLYYGGDRMNFFKMGDSMHVMNYKIRNAMIDYFHKYDTISPKRDDRFIRTNDSILLTKADSGQ